MLLWLWWWCWSSFWPWCWSFCLIVKLIGNYGQKKYGIHGSDGGDSGDGGGNSDGDEGDDDDADGDGGDVDKSGAVLGITNRNRGSMGTQQIMMGK